MSWETRLKTNDSSKKVRFLSKVFSYNIFPTTHKVDISIKKIYIIDCFLKEMVIDFPFIIFHTVIMEAKQTMLEIASHMVYLSPPCSRRWLLGFLPI